jgi:hypothetical protein
MLATVLTLVLAFAGPWSPMRDAPLLINLSPSAAPVDRVDSARLARAIESECARPAMKCRIVPALQATTFLHVSVGRPDAGNPKLLFGQMGIASQIMIPGSISARDSSMERLAVKLLTALRARQAESAGVVQLAPTDTAQ